MNELNNPTLQMVLNRVFSRMGNKPVNSRLVSKLVMILLSRSTSTLYFAMR